MTDESNSFEEFIASLNVAEKKRVEELIRTLRTPCEEWRNSESDILDEKFSAEFRSRLLTQHAFQGSTLFQETFDQAFISSLRAGGHEVKEAPAGERFWDINLNNKRVSLKSTKEKALRRDFLKISKLTEAAWIQDCRMASQRKKRTTELFEEYLRMVHRIFQLRYFVKDRLYELVEIPVSLFYAIKDVPVDAYNSEGPTIGIPVGQDPPDFKLKLDRSDAKITLTHIRKDVCIVHGTWKIG